MSLTPQERQRIEDEEHRLYHEEAYRAKVRKELREEPPEKPRRPAQAIVAALMTLILVSAIASQTHLPAGVAVVAGIVGAALVGKKVL